MARADQLALVLNLGGSKLKGISFSGDDPSSILSDDGVTIHISDMKWFPRVLCRSTLVN